ncbi:stage II sporulation protein M [Candidatus Woesearchaeota archaeon]|nr:stage II sporulation protein M [Candidatus Woesearchaeota archaeon]
MVLEQLISPKNAEKKPFEVFFIGFFYASVAMFLSLWIFRDQTSLVMVFLTVMASLPLVYDLIKYEEKKDLVISREYSILKEHGKALSVFMFLFLGAVVAYSLWYIFLPESIIGSVFNTQISTIKNINSNIFGRIITSGTISSASLFGKILANNLKVLLFSIFFSFFFGAGAIFILIWNASVISTAIGNFFRTNIVRYAESIGFVKTAGYFHIFSLGLLRYFIHGLPEILGYFVGGLAGGIISIAVTRHEIGTKQFKKILLDSVDLIIIAVGLLFVAALLEVYVTPIFF